MGYQPGYRVSFGPRITPMVKYLIIANVVVFIWESLAGLAGGWQIIHIFGLTPAMVVGRLYLWQLVSYLFLHAGFFHIFFNMFALWMFGSELERHWGGKAFLRYYFVSGIGAGILSVVISPFSTIPTIGASGAVYGVLLAYGLMFPERYVFLYFLVPIKVKYFVAIIGAITFFSALSAPGSTVAHVAHLGGMLFGFLYLKGWLTLSGLRQSYHRWRLKRMRSKFKVYSDKHPRHDDDFWIN